MIIRVKRLWQQPFSRPFLHLLLWVNIVGAVFGFNWYVGQLMQLPLYTWIMVFDSPLSVTAVALVMLLRLVGRSLPWLEWWAALAVIKYGAWAALLWIGSWATGTPITTFDFLGLFLTHIGMIIQGFLILKRTPPISRRLLAAVVSWFFINDYFDYAHKLHPTIPSRLFVWSASTAVLLSLIGAYIAYRQWKVHQKMTVLTP